VNILHVIATLAPRDGGPSKACVEMARAVARRGHAVTIFTTDKDGSGRLDVPTDRPVERDGVTLHYFPTAVPRFWARSPAMADALAAAIPGVDVVHMHSLYHYHDMMVGRFCRRSGVPYILRPHGSLDPYLWRRHRLRKMAMELAFQNRVTRGAARLHFTTEDERTLAAPYTFGVPGFVVPNGLDLDEFDNLPPAGNFRDRHPEIGERPLALFLGRLNFKKGLDILCDAFAMVARDLPEARLVIAGPDDGMAEAVKSWLAERGVADRVLFTGMLTGADKYAVLRDADLFVLPSYTENFGIAVIEALACGVPVAISDRVGVWREIEAAGAGWITPVDAAAFAGAMRAGLTDRPAARARGLRGRELVARDFSWPNIAVELERNYVEIVGGVSARGRS
jgi:glycosyltransferase involved in cell wall biosynthesis